MDILCMYHPNTMDERIAWQCIWAKCTWSIISSFGYVSDQTHGGVMAGKDTIRRPFFDHPHHKLANHHLPICTGASMQYCIVISQKPIVAELLCLYTLFLDAFLYDFMRNIINLIGMGNFYNYVFS